MDSSSFAGLSIDSWIKAILHPNAVLGIPIFDVEYFQLSVVIVLDVIWCARNNRIHNNVIPNFQCLLIQVQFSIAIHQKAWSDKDFITSWSPHSFGYLKLNFDVAIYF
ncbi:hypothetical protein SLA2020_414950 [Shorea laevis]